MSDAPNTVHWTSTKFSETLLVDALLKHILGLMQYGMCDLGEVFEVIGQLKPNDEECWINAWSVMARRLQTRAEEADRADKRPTASSTYLRAATYWRASLLYFSHPEDSRLSEHACNSSKCYARYLDLSGYPGEQVEIPYEGTFLPGYFFRSPTAGQTAPLLIITPGRDTWADDTCWVYDAAIRRGIHCLVYDGPGQGRSLRLNNLPFRPDWENVVKPVVDFALDIAGVDPSRIGLMGLSFGAFLSVRAAAFEKRLKVCIADPGSLSWGEAILGHFPPPVRQVLIEQGAEALPETFKRTDQYTSLMWLVRDYAWKHGVRERDAFKALLAYDNKPIVEQIECETLVMDGTEEIAKGQAQRLFDALKCPKHYLLFDGASTAQAHCQIGAYSTASASLLDWLQERL